MFCFRYKRHLIPYCEGALGEAERADVEAHLSRCAGCRSELEAVRSVSGALRSVSVPAMEPTTDLWAKVSARIETETARPAFRPWLRVSQAASACAAAALLAIVGIGMFGPEAPAPAPKRPPAVELRAEKPAPRVVAPMTEKPRTDQESAGEIRRIPPRPRAVVTRPGASAETARRVAVPPPTPAPERFAAVRETEAKPTGLDGEYAWDDKDDDAKARANHLHADAATAPTSKPVTRLGAELVDRRAVTSSASVPAAVTAPSAGLAFGTRGHPACGDTPELNVEPDITNAESVVDTLNETEGLHVAALFAYP